MSLCSNGHTNLEMNKFCSECGEFLVKPQTAIDEKQERSDISRSRLSRILLVAGIAVIALLGIGYLSGSDDDVKSFGYSNIDSGNATRDQSKQEPPVKIPEPSWMPDGFIEWDDSIGFRWVTADCDSYTDYCATAEFISKSGCTYFYAAINLLDNSGAVIGYTNESLPSLAPLQKAKLTFGFFENAEKVQMADITCS